MKPPRFYRSLVLLICLNGIIKPIWIFAIDRQVQNRVGAASYGLYFSLFNLSLVFAFLLDLGFTAYYNRQLAAINTTAYPVGSFLQLKFILSLFYAVFIVVVAWLSGVQDWEVLLLLVLLQIFTSLFLFFRGLITANQWYRADAVLSVLDKTLMILFCGLLLYYPPFASEVTIKSFAALQAICLAASMMAAVIFLKIKKYRLPAGPFGLPGMQVWRQVAPFAAIILLMSMHARLDAFLLERMRADGAQQAGIYAGSYRLLDAANMVGYLVASFLLPYFARQWSAKADFTSVLLTCRHLLLSFSIGSIIICLFLAPWIQQLLYHNTDTHYVSILRYCMPALIGYALTQVYGTALTAAGFIRNFCIITGLSVLINLLLNLWLIPAFGAKGACIAAISSQCFNGIFCMVYASRKLKLVVDWRSIVVYLVTAVALSLLFYFGLQASFNKWILICGAILITFVLLVSTRLLRPAGLIQLDHPQ